MVLLQHSDYSLLTKEYLVKEVWSPSQGKHWPSDTYKRQFGTDTTQPRLPAATRSNEAQIPQKVVSYFTTVLTDVSTKTKNLWLLAKARHASNSKLAFPTVTQQQFLRLQLLAVATWMIGDLDFLVQLRDAPCRTLTWTICMNIYIYIYIYIYIKSPKRARKNKIKYSLQALHFPFLKLRCVPHHPNKLLVNWTKQSNISVTISTPCIWNRNTQNTNITKKKKTKNKKKLHHQTTNFWQ